uniref:Uncharacterized protein n=1 Tax=Arundo donax TaxID=35708 RepID=A0A0A9FU45_ARUDO
MEAGVQQPTATGNQQPQQNNSTDAQPPAPPEASEVKPPSLELTKFAFAGFLAVSIPSITNCSLSRWTHTFILLTAISVVSALVWRLLAHKADPSPAEVVAAVITSSFAHAFAIAALVPFAVMADMNARLVVPDCHQQTVETKRSATTRAARRPASLRTANWVQLESAMRHMSSSGSQTGPASAADLRGPGTSGSQSGPDPDPDPNPPLQLHPPPPPPEPPPRPGPSSPEK